MVREWNTAFKGRNTVLLGLHLSVILTLLDVLNEMIIPEDRVDIMEKLSKIKDLCDSQTLKNDITSAISNIEHLITLECLS